MLLYKFPDHDAEDYLLLLLAVLLEYRMALTAPPYERISQAILNLNRVMRMNVVKIERIISHFAFKLLSLRRN
jgi:hypothetical protein